ncbi:MAG: GNAT family N-acetyltransferase [Halomonas sp.]|uniref:GNAT family N-acetyltransferase n=1 Tax=Halomonas sp. TaxID=1486246 RepID=UPI003F92BFD4
MTIRVLAEPHAADAAALLGLGMRDNPTHLSAFGNDPVRRERTLTKMFTPFLRQQMRTGLVLGAFSALHTATPGSEAAQLVGVAGLSAPGHCQPDLKSKLQALPAFVHFGGVSASRQLLSWVRAWSRRDAAAPAHWHLGPLAVAPQHQGCGVGSALLQQLCDHLDQQQALGYLETDKSENVTLYQRFGFTTLATETVIGTTHWFMSREPGLIPR